MQHTRISTSIVWSLNLNMWFMQNLFFFWSVRSMNWYLVWSSNFTWLYENTSLMYLKFSFQLSWKKNQNFIWFSGVLHYFIHNRDIQIIHHYIISQIILETCSVPVDGLSCQENGTISCTRKQWYVGFFILLPITKLPSWWLQKKRRGKFTLQEGCSMKSNSCLHELQQIEL